MIQTHTYNGETWIDIDQGTSEEVHDLMDKYKIHPFVAKELTSTTHKPRIEFHGDYIYCILHFPAFKHSHSKDQNQEVDFIIGKNLLITARYDAIDALHKFSKTIEVKEVLEKNVSEKSSHVIFTSMLKDLYGSLFNELEYIEDVIEKVVNQIFRGREHEMVLKISEINRTLLNFKKVTDWHHDVLESLHHNGRKIFGEQFGKEIESIILDYLKLHTIIKSHLDMLHELRNTNDSLLTTKQNDIFKKLTIINFIILPLTVISQLFGMSFRYIPFINNPNGFWIILVLMVSSITIALVYVRHKKWI